MTEEPPLEVEATGETVGEAKWRAVRELERLRPGLDRDAVVFEVIAEGERGLLGVGTAPARVRARVDPVAASSTPATGESAVARMVHDALARIAQALGANCHLDVREDETAVVASLSGPDAGLLIGRRGRTIDAVQQVVGAIAYRAQTEPRKAVVVDVASYRARREARLADTARRAAERVRRTGETVALEPMTPTERRLVHLSLRDVEGVTTRSEGEEPYRHVVVFPARE